MIFETPAVNVDFYRGTRKNDEDENLALVPELLDLIQQVTIRNEFVSVFPDRFGGQWNSDIDKPLSVCLFLPFT